MRRIRAAVLRTVWLSILIATPAAAQTRIAAPDPASVRVRLGPLWLNPTLMLTNAGVDTNVFNQPIDDDPKRDLTATVTPASDVWLMMGRTWLTGSVREELVWYKKYASERSANQRYRVGWLAPLARIAFQTDAAWLDTRERPGFEIDTRAHRRESAYTGQVELRALAATLIGAHAGVVTTDYVDDPVFLGVSLRERLNRTSTSAGLTVRHELTPLTSIGVGVSRTQDRFEFSGGRDTDSTQADLTLSFDPQALLKGSARFGVRSFTPKSADVPDYQGPTAAVDLSYVAGGVTRLGLGVTRDVNYSFELVNPYYVQTGISGSVAQQIFGPVDAVGRAAAQRLDYRTRTGATLLGDRVDRVRSYGGGIGYHLGQNVRVGFNVDRAKRTSMVHRDYAGLRYGVTMAYGQ